MSEKTRHEPTLELRRNKKLLSAASIRKAIKIDVRRAMNFNQAERVINMPAAASYACMDI
jgi:hypothetical protein